MFHQVLRAFEKLANKIKTYNQEKGSSVRNAAAEQYNVNTTLVKNCEEYLETGGGLKRKTTF